MKTIEEHKPDVEFAESFRKVDHNNMWLIRDIAKKLEQNGVIIAEKNLRSFLEEAKFMFRNGLGKWELYSNVVAKGYGVYRSYFVDKYSGERVNQQTVYMTGSGCSRRSSLYKMACRARLPRRKNKLEGSDLRSRPRSFRWCGSHSKKYDSRIPVFPV